MQLGSAQNVHNHTELVVIAVSTEEWKTIKDHSGHDAAEGPHIDRVIVVLQNEQTVKVYLVVEKQLGTLVIASTYTNVARKGCELVRCFSYLDCKKRQDPNR